jgi:hypothetical protein
MLRECLIEHPARPTNMALRKQPHIQTYPPFQHLSRMLRAIASRPSTRGRKSMRRMLKTGQQERKIPTPVPASRTTRIRTQNHLSMAPIHTRMHQLTRPTGTPPCLRLKVPSYRPQCKVKRHRPGKPHKAPSSQYRTNRCITLNNHQPPRSSSNGCGGPKPTSKPSRRT